MFSFKSLALFVLIFSIFLCDIAEAQFASQFSLSAREEYNDNIFFTKLREHDFITQITPTISILYKPPLAPASTLRLNISPIAQIFARHSEQNNFGRDLFANGDYIHPVSPRLTFNFTDTLRLQGNTRTVGVDPNVNNPLPNTPTTPPAPGLPPSQALGNIISSGKTLSNYFSAFGSYLITPNISFSGNYTNGYTAFIDAGGSDISNAITARSVYKWRQDHNLHAGYTLTLISPRTGGNNVIHNFDLGDDFFSSTQIQLTPTLTLSASTGISLNAGGNGPRIANNSTATLIKIWETASLSAGVRKGLTNSLGVAGLSDTLTLFSSFNIRLSERLSAMAGVDHSRFDTDNVDFNTLQATAGVQFALTSWLCQNFQYRHSRRVDGAGARNTILQTQGNVFGNSVLLSITGTFDLWPTLGLGRQPCRATGAPAVLQQFPQAPRL